MVDLRMRKREMRGDERNHLEKPGLKRISWASQFNIPDTACTSPDLACNYTHSRSSQPSQANRTPDFPYQLVSSTSFSSSSSISLFHVHNSNIIIEHKVELSLSISPCYNHELTPSTAYTEYPTLFVFPSFSWLRVDPWMWLQLAACLPTRSTAIS